MDMPVNALHEVMLALSAYMWPMLRISGLLLVLPAISGAYVPIQARIILAVALTFLAMPAAAAPVDVQIFSFDIVPLAGIELLIGLAMGFALKLVLDAVALGGQSVAMSMGLGFAIFIDSARGVNVPVISQFLMLLATLIFLALDGHLSAIAMLIESFKALPIGGPLAVTDLASGIVRLSVIVFTGAVQIALPAVSALLIVNLAFGVMSRAAPTLNLFAVGFPVSLLFGILALMLTLDGFSGVVGALLAQALGFVQQLAGGTLP